MAKSSAFMVHFSGLSFGKHSFEFEIDNAFFEKLEYSLIEKGEVHVKMELERKPDLLILNFKLEGFVAESCDRCAVDYTQKINGENRIYVKFGDDFDEPSDGLLVIPRESYQLDISHIIYEFIELSVPIRKVPCEEMEDTSLCDVEVLKVLEESEVENKNNGSVWAGLKDIKEQLKKK